MGKLIELAGENICKNDLLEATPLWIGNEKSSKTTCNLLILYKSIGFWFVN